MKTLPLLLSALLLAAALPAAAQQMNYQGRLTDASGNALTDGRYTVEFSLWDAATGGTQIWGPYVLDGAAGNGHAPQIELVNGRFNAVLGAVDTTNRPLVNAFAATRYLQIKVGANTPITPRQVILDAPSALSARTAEVANSLRNVYTVGESVGIGTNAPKQTLHVNGDTYAKGHVWLHAYEGDGLSGTAYLQARDDSTTSNIDLVLRTKRGATLNENLRLNNDGTTTFNGRAYLGSASFSGNAAFNDTTFFAYGAVMQGDLTLQGNSHYIEGMIQTRLKNNPANPALWIQNIDGSNQFSVYDKSGPNGIVLSNGTASKPGGGSWAALSDIRLKKDVKDLSGSLPKLLQLHSVTFDYKEPVRLGAKGRQTGFIAQEVEKVFPEWIIEGTLPGKNGDEPDATKYKSISITGFESLTVQALRELRDEKDSQIKTLTAENTSLRDTVKAQEARLAKLEQAVAALATTEEKPAKATARR